MNRNDHRVYISPTFLITVVLSLICAVFSASSRAQPQTLDCDQLRIDSMSIRLAYDKDEPFEMTYIKYQGRDEYNIKMRYVTILVYQGHSDSISMSEFGDMMRDLCLVSNKEAGR